MGDLDALLSLHSDSAQHPAHAGERSCKRASPAVDLEVEPYSGLRVKASSRALSRDDVAVLAKGFAVHRLSEVPQVLRKPAAQLASSPWMTIAVVVERGAAKPTQNGGKFCVWKVSDLRSPGTTISTFLFGEACEVAWKYLPGTVFALLNPKAVPPKEGGSMSDCAMSVEKQPQLQRIGQVQLTMHGQHRRPAQHQSRTRASEAHYHLQLLSEHRSPGHPAWCHNADGQGTRPC